MSRLVEVDRIVKTMENWKPYVKTADVISALEKCKTVDAVEVVRSKDCFANGCCSVQIDLDMGDEGYCPKGRKEN